MPSLYNAAILASDHPLLLALALFAVLHFAWARLGATAAAPAGRLVAVLATLALAAFAAILVTYLRYPAYFDRVEPAVTSVSWLFMARGYPLYPSPEDPHRYAHVYGPVLFLIEGGALRLLQPTLFVSKLVGVVAAAASLAALFVACRRYTNARTALSATGAVAAAGLAFQVVAYWNRPDPLLLLLVTIATAAAASSWRPGVWVFAIAAGLAANLKITAALYFVPLVPLLLARYSLPVLAAGAAVSVATLVAPFLLPRVDAASYWYWLRYCTGGTLVPRSLLSNLEYSVVLLLPALATAALGWRGLTTAARWTVAALVASTVGVAVLAAIPGAGPYHLLPFAPMAILIALRSAPDAITAARLLPALAAAGLVLASIAGFQQYRVLASLEWDQAAHLRASADEVRAAFPDDRVALLYGGDRAVSSMVRPLFVFDRDPYIVDGPAVMDHQMGGIEVPPGTAALLDRCTIDVALIPTGTRPLSSRNLYPSTGHREAFAGAFADTFARRFRLVETRGGFDVYRCEPATAGP
jgi:hypothetical protein